MHSAEEVESFRTYASDGAHALQQLEQSLLKLEGTPRDLDEVNSLYRALHTIKGNSALLGLTRIETVAHAAEDMVGLVRDRGVEFGSELVELMLRFKDQLGDCITRVGEQHCDADEGAFADLVEDIQGWILNHGGITREAQGAARGELVTFSSVPACRVSFRAPQDALGADPILDLERTLGSARELLSALVENPFGGAESHAFRLSEELRLSCARQGEAALASSVARIGELVAAAASDFQRMHQEVGELGARLAMLEARRLKATGIPDDFGIQPMCMTLREVLSRGSASTEKAQGMAGQPRPAPAVTRGNPTPKAIRPGVDAGEDKPDYLRIDARKLSLLMELAGEIALACGAVTRHPGLPEEMPEGFVHASQKLELLIRELQNEVSATRLVPVAGVFQRMKRVVRDICQRTGKKVDLVLIGEDTEIDKVMVDALHDPLVHLVRNAIDHGIEAPADRLAAGKPETGRVVLEAMHQGGEVSVQLHDDGRGMSRQRIRARATESGLMEPNATMSDEQILEFVFHPGFSTKSTIDELSGRGVGMDVIRTTVRNLRGQVHIDSREGYGSSIKMTLPLTLAFVEAMVVRERDQLFALPIEKVIEVFKPEPQQLVESSADGSMALRLRERLIPVLWLHRYFNETAPVDERLDERVIVVTQTGRGVVAIPVQALLGNQPIMLKPLRGVLSRVRAAAGCGMLRTGDVALALDTDGLHV